MKEKYMTIANEEQDKLIEMYEQLSTEKDKLTDAVVDDMMWRIKKTSRELLQMEERKNDAMVFYGEKCQQIKWRIERIAQIVENYIRTSDRKTVDTPNGTARLRSVNKIRWDKVKEEELISFSLENDIEMSKRPKKTAILTYIKNTGDAPEWFEEYTEKSFSYQIKEDEDDTT